MITIGSLYNPDDSPGPRGVSMHIAAPDIEKHLLIRVDQRVIGATLERRGDAISSLSGGQPTEAACELASRFSTILKTGRICRIQPSERHGYQVCITWWPDTWEIYLATRSVLEIFLGELLPGELIRYDTW